MEKKKKKGYEDSLSWLDSGDLGYRKHKKKKKFPIRINYLLNYGFEPEPAWN